MAQQPGPEDDDPESYVGLSEDQARRQGEQRGWAQTRVVTGENPVITLEYLPGRINFHVEDGRVVRCWLH